MPRQVRSPQPPARNRGGYPSLLPQFDTDAGGVVTTPDFGSRRFGNARRRGGTVRGGSISIVERPAPPTPYDPRFNEVNQALTAPEGSLAMPRWLSPERDPNYEAQGLLRVDRYPRRIRGGHGLVANQMLGGADNPRSLARDLTQMFRRRGGQQDGFFDFLRNVRGMTRQLNDNGRGMTRQLNDNGRGMTRQLNDNGPIVGR